MKKSFNIQELWHHKSKRHGTQAHATPSSLLRAFQRHGEHDLKHPTSVDLVTTKQNKLWWKYANLYPALGRSDLA